MLEKQQYHPHFKTTNSTISDNLAINFPIHTELADYLSPAENIAEHLTPWFHFKGLTQDQILPELQQIFIMLRTRTTHDFSSYKLNTICRRIEKQMSAHHIHALNEYVRLLRDHPREIDNLFKDLLIGVTSFFRDTEAFELLKQMLINLLKSKPPEYYLRVWIPACSTGEEAYSIAIIIHECLEEIQLNHKVKIFSTDIDLSALETARAGIYPAIISNDITPIRLKKYFFKEKNNYRIKNEIREMVVYGQRH